MRVLIGTSMKNVSKGKIVGIGLIWKWQRVPRVDGGGK